jgi:hypothetical protein
MGALAVSLSGASAGSAAAGTFDALAGLRPISDATLQNMRGEFIVAPVRGATAAAATVGARLDPLLSQSPAAAVASAGRGTLGAGLANVSSGGGQVVYFGLQVVSSWQVATATGPAGVSAGATIGVDLRTGTPSISTWTTSTNNGLPSTPSTGGSIDGTPPATSVVNGVGQSVQVAGNGNSVSNQATVQVGQIVPVLSPGPPSNAPPCGAACSVSFDGTGLHVSIATPQGVVSQAVGQNGITQSVALTSDFNQISNQLGVNVQLANPSQFSAGSLLPTIQNVIGIH